MKTRDILTYHYIEIRYFIIILGVFSDEEKDTLDRRLGPTIREIGNRHGLSVTNLKSALAESFNDRRKGWADENVEYGEETIGGYLYDRTWPDMEC